MYLKGVKTVLVIELDILYQIVKNNCVKKTHKVVAAMYFSFLQILLA